MAQTLRIPNFGTTKSLRSIEESSERQWSPVRSLQFPVWLKETYDRISDLSDLNDNWDSYGSSCVSSKAISIARVLLSNIEFENVPKPHISAVPDGGVGFHWRVGGRDLELEVDPNGTVHFVKTDVGKDVLSGELDTLKDAQVILDWVIGW